MSATERVAALGSGSTISGWAAISPSRKSSRFAHHRVHRRLDYPASLGLDHKDFDGLFDLKLANARDCSDSHGCPQCGNQPEDSNYEFFVFAPQQKVDETGGIRYVGCVCGTVYRLGFRSSIQFGVHPNGMTRHIGTCRLTKRLRTSEEDACRESANAVQRRAESPSRPTP
jgi:hypothetical protein